MVGESYIEIEGKRHKLLFTMYQLQRMAELIDEKGGFNQSYNALIYSALETACRRSKEDVPVSYDDLSFIVDDIFSDGSGEGDRIMNDYQQSNIYKRMNPQEEKKMIHPIG